MPKETCYQGQKCWNQSQKYGLYCKVVKGIVNRCVRQWCAKLDLFWYTRILSRWMEPTVAEHEVQRTVPSCSETVTESLLNLFNETPAWGTNLFTSQILLNTACCLRAPYAVTVTVLPPPRQPHCCLMALCILKCRKWSLDAFKDCRKINK